MGEEQEVPPPGLKAVSAAEELWQDRTGLCSPCPTSCGLSRGSQGQPWSLWDEPVTAPALFFEPLLNFSPTCHGIWRMNLGMAVTLALCGWKEKQRCCNFCLYEFVIGLWVKKSCLETTQGAESCLCSLLPAPFGFPEKPGKPSVVTHRNSSKHVLLRCDTDRCWREERGNQIILVCIVGKIYIQFFKI